MTVLEKIKRCVELVWDFEEIYDWSDIEAFCGAELATYPQHDEILDYFKQIEELEKENAELKKEVELWKKASETNSYKAFQLQEENKSLTNIKNIYIGDLLKAKEIIKDLLGSENTSCEEEMFFEIRQKAEQFLKESE